MFDIKNLRQFGITKTLKSFFLYLVLLILTRPSVLQAHPCENASMQLQGDLGVVINRGGLWSLMEQRGLKENSVIGMQADSKLARLVGHFETLCESEKKPTKQLFVTIENLLGEARTIFNPRSSGEEIFKLVENLVKELDALLAKIE